MKLREYFKKKLNKSFIIKQYIQFKKQGYSIIINKNVINL